jgi:hypothetical protein
MAFLHQTVLFLAFFAYAQSDRDAGNIFGEWQVQLCIGPLGQMLPPSICPTTTVSPTTTTTTTEFTTPTIPTTTSSEFTIGVTPTTDDSVEIGVTTSSTPLERAHWCKFQNGSTIALGYSFMYSACAVCQCLPNRLIRCTNLPCMSTFCIDGSQPTRREGQCCAQCAYENNSNTCTYNSISVPHGSVVKRTSTGETCWCQWGTMECRRIPGANTASLIWGDGTAIYLVVIIMVVVLIVGTLSCVGCSVYFYYYYQKRNQHVNEEQEQYWNHAGWQPMAEDGTVEEKKVEAEQVVNPEEHPNGFNPAYIPPPYVTYNGVYPNEKSQ